MTELVYTLSVFKGTGKDFAAARAVREAVFLREQGIDPAEEWDDIDRHAIHAVAFHTGDGPVGTGRMYEEEDGTARIGRMAVVAEHRGCGVGRMLMEALLEAAAAVTPKRIVLHAQTHAKDFYARFGFEPFGEAFDEAGIPHIAMRRFIPGCETKL